MKNNFVAKNAHRFNKAVKFDDKTKYKRHPKHKGVDRP